MSDDFKGPGFTTFYVPKVDLSEFPDKCRFGNRIIYSNYHACQSIDAWGGRPLEQVFIGPYMTYDLLKDSTFRCIDDTFVQHKEGADHIILWDHNIKEGYTTETDWFETDNPEAVWFRPAAQLSLVPAELGEECARSNLCGTVREFIIDGRDVEWSVRQRYFVDKNSHPHFLFKIDYDTFVDVADYQIVTIRIDYVANKVRFRYTRYPEHSRISDMEYLRGHFTTLINPGQRQYFEKQRYGGR